MVRRVEIGLLGPLRVTVDGHEVRLPAKQQVLLTVLALDRGTVSAERLLTALWGEDAPPGSVRTLQSHVFQLRRALQGAPEADPGPGGVPEAGPGPGGVPEAGPGPGGVPEAGPGPGGVPADDPRPAAIETDGRGYRLQVEPSGIDSRQFESLVAGARPEVTSRPRAPTATREAIELLDRALALWRGHDVADVGGEPAATAEVDRLIELRHGAFDDLVRLRLSLGETAEVIPELRRELRAHPYREPLWASLMRALDASGRKAEALLAYREATVALRAELDVEPGAELMALAQRIRSGGATPPAERPMPEPGPPAGVAQLLATIQAPAAPQPPLQPMDVGRPLQPMGGRGPSGRRPGTSMAAAALVAGALVAVVAGSRLMPGVGWGPGATQGSPAVASMSGVATEGIAMLDAKGDVTGGTALPARAGAVTSGAGSLWVSSPTDGTVLRVDPTSHEIIQRVAVGGGPAGIASGFDAIWVADSSDGSITRIDPATDQVVATIDVGTAPEGVATDAHWVWVTDRLDHAITRIDPRDGSTRSFALGASPVAIAVAAGWLWIADAGDGDVSQVDPATGTVVRTIPVGSDPTAIAASPDGQAVWVANSGSGTVFRIDAQTSEVTGAQAVGADPTGIAVDDATVWVAVAGADEVVRVDPSTTQVVGRTTFEGGPRSVVATDGRVAVTTGAAAGSHRGGALRVLYAPGDTFDTIDPTYSEWYLAAQWVLTNDPLVTFKRVGGPDGMTIVPDLAQDIPTPTDGGRTWAFRLRPGLVYSTGKLVQASDALPSFERGVLAANAAQTTAGMFGDTEIVGSSACGARPPCDLSAGITTDDDTGTITFHLTMPDQDFPERIVGVPILPADTPLTRSAEPVPATGPYVIEAFDPGRSEHLVRNPRFVEWSRDAQPDGNPDEIDIRVSDLADPASEVLSGAADILALDAEPATRLAQLRTEVPGQLHIAPSDSTWFEYMNTNLPPFDDPRVRDAVELATDRDALVSAWGGPLVASVTCQVVPPGFVGYTRYCPWTVDPRQNGDWLGPDMDRAQALIDAAGVRGTQVTVWGLQDGGPHARVADYFSGLLGELGFQAATHLVDFDHYFTTLNDHFDQIQMAGAWNSAEDRVASETVIGVFTCPSYPTPYQGRAGAWCDPGLDDRIQAAVQLQTDDPIAADAEWADIDRTIVDAAPAVMAFNPTDATLVSTRTGGFESQPELGVLYDQLWVR